MDYAIPDLYLAASPDSKTKLLTGFKAAPFVEPANGLVYVRDRWYDPGTGSWLTPDANGYSAGSSNLYAAFLNDPVNNSDPDGREPVTATAYLGWVALNTGVDVLIDWGFHEWLGPDDQAFDWGKSLTFNFGVNVVTGGIGGKVAKLKHLEKLNNPVTRRAIAEGLEFGADVGATGTLDMALNDQGPVEAYASAALGHLGGRAFRSGVDRAERGIRGFFDTHRIEWHPGMGSGFGALGEINLIKDQRKYLVYSIRDFDDRVIYVGRPSGFGDPLQILRRREARHAHVGKGRFRIEEMQLSYQASRGAEDVIFNRQRLGALHEGRTLLNKINPISPWNPRARTYISAWMTEPVTPW